MQHFGWDFEEKGNKFTPYQIKHGGKIMGFFDSQKYKKLASIIRMHEQESKVYDPFWDSL